MITPSAEDWRAAEDVILGEHDSYFFRGPCLKRKGNRILNLEMALIDILRRYDNEGDRVILSGYFPTRINKLQQRLHHIRQHTDPNFIKRDIEEQKRENSENFMRKILEDSPFPGRDRPYDYLESRMNTMEGALGDLEHAKEVLPHLAHIKWYDPDEKFKDMVMKTGMIDHPNDAPFSFSGVDFFFEYDCGPNYNVELTGGIEVSLASMALLREDERDEFAQDIIIMRSENKNENNISDKFPHIKALIKEYEERCRLMRGERGRIEKELMEFGVDKKPPKDIRESHLFPKFEGIGMFVDPEYLATVKYIITDQRAEMAVEVIPEDQIQLRL